MAIGLRALGPQPPSCGRRAADAVGMERSKVLDRSRTDLARRYSALGDPARQAILEELRGRTRCLCELEADLGFASNLLSYHMKQLRQAGLVSGSRRGRRVEYRIEPAGLDGLKRDLEWLATPTRGSRLRSSTLAQRAALQKVPEQGFADRQER